MEPLSWRALEYRDKKRTKDWFWAVGIIVVSTSITSFIFGNFLFGILLIVGTLALMLYVTRPPQEIDISIDADGIGVGKEFYPYKDIHSFGIVEDAYPRILLKLKKKFLPYAIFPIENMPLENLKEYLRSHLPEEDLHESVFEILMDRLGF